MGVGFKLIKDAQDTEYKKLRIASQAYTIGDAVMLDRTADAVDVVPATAASVTYNIYAVAMETVTSAATEVLCALVHPRQTWTVDCTNTPTTDDNYQRMILTDKATVNNTHTDSSTSSGVFMQTGVVGAASAKRIVGKFLKVANITA